MMASARWPLLAAALLALVALSALSACALPPLGGPSDLQLTWDEAVVALPAGAGGGENGQVIRGMGEALRRLEGQPVDGPLPVLLYLHGCTGIHDLALLERLAGEGFVVIAPDSLARRYRPLQCDPATLAGGFNLFVYDFRLAEVAFAVQRIKALEWADKNRLFLLGVSEGGVAGALYRGDEFRARVIAQWSCHGAPHVAGIAAPRETPILAVMRAYDPWYNGGQANGQNGDCGAYLEGRPGSRSLVLPANGGHDVFDDPTALEQVIAFLTAHRAD